MVKETEKMNNNKEIPRWYILHTYSGHEDKVKDNLQQRIKNMDLQEIQSRDLPVSIGVQTYY